MLYFALVIAERRPNRQRKPVIPFDEIVRPSAKPAKPRKPRTTAPKALEPHNDPAPAKSSNNKAIQEDPVQLLCKQTQGLDLQASDTDDTTHEAAEEAEAVDEAEAIEEAVNLDLKAKKKVKAKELARLKQLSFNDILKEVPDAKDIEFEPFSPGRTREPECVVPPNIDLTDPLALLDLFIPPAIYTTIAENTNLYAIAKGAATAPTATNSRY